MIRRLTFTVLWAGLAATAFRPVSLSEQEHTLPRVAILEFDAAPGGWTIPPPHLGETVAQLVVARLVGAREFHVLDGQWLRRGLRAGTANEDLDALLANARAADVNYVVLGSISQFSVENGQRSGGIMLPHLPVAGFNRKTNRLAVSILARIVDVQTGEIVTTGSGNGVGARRNLSIGGLLPRPFGFGGFRNRSSDTRDAQLNEALTVAVERVAQSLVNASPRLVAGHSDAAHSRVLIAAQRLPIADLVAGR